MTPSNTFLPGFEARDHRGARACGCALRRRRRAPPSCSLHGLGGAASNWTLVAPRSPARYRVVVPDLPGHGGSSALPGAGWRPLDPLRRPARRACSTAACRVRRPLARRGRRPAARRPPPGCASAALVLAGAVRESARHTPGRARVLTLAAVVKPGKRLSPLGARSRGAPLLKRVVFGRCGVADPARARRRVRPKASSPARGCTPTSRTAGDALVRDRVRASIWSAFAARRSCCRGARDTSGTASRRVPVRAATRCAAARDRRLRSSADRRAPGRGGRRDLRVPTTGFGRSRNSHSSAELARLAAPRAPARRGVSVA